MDEFSNAFELAGYTATDALNDVLEQGHPDLLAFFLGGDDEEADLVLESIQLQESIERCAEIMRENWPQATMSVLITPAENELGQPFLNVWAFGYGDGAEARFSLGYLVDSGGVLVHEVESAFKVPQGSAPDVFAQVAFLDFIEGAQAHAAGLRIWPQEVVDRLLSNLSSGH